MRRGFAVSRACRKASRTWRCAAGHYQNASEVLRDGLRLLEDQVEQRKAELAAIQLGVVAGYDQIERGDFAPGTGQEAIERVFERAAKNGVYEHLSAILGQPIVTPRRMPITWRTIIFWPCSDDEYGALRPHHH